MRGDGSLTTLASGRTWPIATSPPSAATSVATTDPGSAATLCVIVHDPIPDGASASALGAAEAAGDADPGADANAVGSASAEADGVARLEPEAPGPPQPVTNRMAANSGPR